jgi:hypothetical protein
MLRNELYIPVITLAAFYKPFNVFGVRKWNVGNKHKFRPKNHHLSLASSSQVCIYLSTFNCFFFFFYSLCVSVYAAFVNFLTLMVHDNSFLKNESIITANSPSSLTMTIYFPFRLSDQNSILWYLECCFGCFTEYHKFMQFRQHPLRGPLKSRIGPSLDHHNHCP